jgi:sulfonate transport system substrate-binding protein
MRTRTGRARPVLALAAVAVAAAASLGGCGGAAAGAGTGGTTVRIAPLQSADALTLGQEDGGIAAALKAKGAGVAFTAPFPAFAPAAEAVHAGSVDITTGSITSVVGALSGDGDVTVFAAQPSDPASEGIAVPKGSPVRTIADLRGRTVAVNRGGTGEYLLLKALRQAGIPANQVTRRYIPPADAAPAFAAGKVDAWAVWGTFFATAQTAYGGRVLTTGGRIGSRNDVVYVARTAFLKAHPDLVKAVADSVFATSAKARTDPARTVGVYRDRLKLPEPVAAYMGRHIASPAAPVDAKTVRRYESVAAFFAKEKVIPAPVTIADHVVDVRTLK